MITRRLLLAAAVAAATPLRAAEAGIIRIGYQKNGILVVAKQQGVIEARLKPLGISVRWSEFSAGPPLLEALGLGSIDFGQTGDAPPVFAQAAGANLVYAASQPGGGSGSAILVPTDSTVKSVAELKGKRVAFAKGSSAHNFIVVALEKAGLGYGDIEPVYLSPADAAAAFNRGAVDAWTVWDPYYAIAERAPTTRVLQRVSEVLVTNNYFLANADTARQQPAVLAAVLDVLAEVAAWCEANRPEVAAALSKVTNVPLDASQRAVERIRFTIAPMNEATIAEQQRVADRFHGLGLIARPIRIAEAVWTPPADAKFGRG